jgi:DNA-binding NtrC family response regulator
MARFLVVDDDHSAVKGMERLLRSDGHDVCTCFNAADAIDAIASERFDVILTDIEMPHLDGNAVIAAARARQPNACLIVATAAQSRHVEVGRSGACFVVDKPIDYDELSAIIDRCRAAHGREETLKKPSCLMLERGPRAGAL